MVFVAVLASAVISVSALASNGGSYEIRYNAADQSAARAVVIRRGDLDPAFTWKGGSESPDLTPWPVCPNFHPKASDLVVTGAARTEFSSVKLRLDYGSQTQLLQTREMVGLDWQRSARIRPALLSCMRSATAKELSPGTRVVSLTKAAIPRIAQHSASVRFVFAGPNDQRSIYRAISFSQGRTEAAVIVFAPPDKERAASASLLHLARTMVARMRA